MSEQKPVPNLMKALRESLEKAVQPPATQQESARVDVVAREIAKELMSNGFGDQGDRLAIRLGSQDFGGWSLDGAARQIRITLEREGYVLDRMAEATRRAQLLASAPPAVWQDKTADELRRIAAHIRTPGNVWAEDAIDEIARLLENRSRQLSPLPSPPDTRRQVDERREVGHQEHHAEGLAVVVGPVGTGPG